MKKRILPLLLVVLMLASLVLVSCGNQETTDPVDDGQPDVVTITTPKGNVIPTEDIWGKFESVKAPETTLVKGEKVNLPANASYYESNSCYIVYKHEISETREIDGVITEVVTANDYIMYIYETGKTLTFRKPVLQTNEDPSMYENAVTTISFNTFGISSFTLPTVAIERGNTGEYDITIYKADGSVAFTVEDYDSSSIYPERSWSSYNADSEFVKVDNVIYRVDYDIDTYNNEREDLNFVKVVDLDESSAPISYLSSMQYDKVADEYYISNNEGIAILDNTLMPKTIIKYERVVNSNINVYTLSNGNKYITETYQVPATFEDYTYHIGATKYVVKAGVYSVEFGYTEVDAPEFIGTVLTPSAYDRRLVAKDESIKNILVNAGKITETKELVSMKDIVVLDDNAKAVKILTTDITSNYYYTETLPNGAIIMKGIYDTTVYNANGEKLGVLPYSYKSNNKWFITDKNVYDATMKSIYEIPEGRVANTIMPNAILFTEKAFDEAGNRIDKYILWKGVDSEVIIAETALSYNELAITNNYYAEIDTTEDYNYNVVIYDSLGNEIYKIVNASERPTFADNYVRYVVRNEETNTTTNIYVPLFINK